MDIKEVSSQPSVNCNKHPWPLYRYDGRTEQRLLSPSCISYPSYLSWCCNYCYHNTDLLATKNVEGYSDQAFHMDNWLVRLVCWGNVLRTLQYGLNF